MKTIKIFIMASTLLLLSACGNTVTSDGKDLSTNEETIDLNTIILDSDFIVENSIPIKDGDPDPDGDYTPTYSTYIDIAIENPNEIQLEDLKVVNMEMLQLDGTSHEINPDQYIHRDCDGSYYNRDDMVQSFTMEGYCAIVLTIRNYTKEAIFNENDAISVKFKIANDVYSTDWIQIKEAIVDYAF